VNQPGPGGRGAGSVGVAAAGRRRCLPCFRYASRFPSLHLSLLVALPCLRFSPLEQVAGILCAAPFVVTSSARGVRMGLPPGARKPSTCGQQFHFPQTLVRVRQPRRPLAAGALGVGGFLTGNWGIPSALKMFYGRSLLRWEEVFLGMSTI